MEALQVKGVANERVITHLQKRVKNLTDEQEQYKSALRTFNQEVKSWKKSWRRRVVNGKKIRSQGDDGEGVDDFVRSGGDTHGRLCKRV